MSAGNRSRNAAALQRLLRSRMARACLLAVAALALLAAVAPLLPLRPPAEPDARRSFAPPTLSGLWEDGHLGPVLGCDGLGRCLLSRTLHGLRISLESAVIAALVSLVIGVFFGVLAGYRGGRTDLAVMRLVDVLDSVPLVFVVIFIQAFLRGVRGGDQAPGGQIWVFFATLGAVTWLTMARLVRAEALALRERGFMEAARALGAPDRWIVRRHLLPNLAPVILVALTITIPRILLFESFLSFLGLGVEAPEVSLGSLARAGLDSVTIVEVRPHLIAVPSAMLFLLLFSVNFLGDAVRDAFDPKAAPADADGDERAHAPVPAAVPAAAGAAPALLSVRNLEVAFETATGRVVAVKDASFDVRAGEALAIVGESGSGKSATLLGLIGLLPRSASVKAAEARFGTTNLLELDANGRRLILGSRIALVPQDPIGSLAPHLSVGYQVAEVIRAHRRTDRATARAQVVRLFEELQIPDAASRFDAKPHELSGGLNQRVLIAMALALEPELIFADEPTTALDVSVQAEILRIFRRIVAARKSALVIVSHDLGVVAGLADRIVVMDQGVVVESAPAAQVLRRPESARTRSILGARRTLEQRASEAVA